VSIVVVFLLAKTHHKVVVFQGAPDSTFCGSKERKARFRHSLGLDARTPMPMFGLLSFLAALNAVLQF
jgi:hypothetical protein